MSVETSVSPKDWIATQLALRLIQPGMTATDAALYFKQVREALDEHPPAPQAKRRS